MFKSFFLAGFECTEGFNAHRMRIDHIKATHHDQFLLDDYRLISEVGIRAVREGISWAQVDCGGCHYDFSWIAKVLEASKCHSLEVVYDLCHFGYPDGIDVFSNEFTRRFADYCYAVARYISLNTEGKCYFTPINEPSYFSWAAGEEALFAPHLKGRSFELKVCLVRAAIAGINAIRAACPTAQIINVDPICRAVPPASDRPDLTQEAANFNQIAVFQSWDMLCGRMLPELGGSPEHLGCIGVNYYWTNQWELGHPEVAVPTDDLRRWPLSKLIHAVWERYRTDILITETSSVGEARPGWIREVAVEAEKLLDANVPLRGICLYPVLSMPLWHSQGDWLHMGLWDLKSERGYLRRIPYLPALCALKEAQRLEGRQWTPIRQQPDPPVRSNG
jgi:hypothetical protein